MDAITETPETSSLNALGEALEAAAGSIHSTGASATQKAKGAVNMVGSGVSSGAYHAAYGVSYGVVFSAVFLKEFLPQSSAVRRGLEEGAEAAFGSVEARREVEVPKIEKAPAKAKPARRATKRVVSAGTSD